MHIDGFQIRIILKNIDNVKQCKQLHYDDEDINNTYLYLIMCDNNNQNQFELDQICSSLWNKNRTMNNCILFGNKSRGYKSYNIGDKMSIKWNIPFMNINYSNSDQINNLLIFSIKYHWFRKVNTPSVIF